LNRFRRRIQDLLDSAPDPGRDAGIFDRLAVAVMTPGRLRCDPAVPARIRQTPGPEEKPIAAHPIRSARVAITAGSKSER